MDDYAEDAAYDDGHEVQAPGLGMNFDFDYFDDGDMDEETADWVNALAEALDGADEAKQADNDDEADGVGEADDCDHVHDEAIEVAHGLHLDNGNDELFKVWETHFNRCVASLTHRQTELANVSHMQFKQKDGLVMWSQRPSPLPKVIPMCLMQSHSGIIGVAHLTVPSADPRQIAWSLSTFKIASVELGVGVTVRVRIGVGLG